MNIFVLHSRLILKHPCACAIASFVIGCSLTVMPFILNELPDFSDPTMGFSTRGTPISNRLDSWHNLKECVNLKQEWTRFPEDLIFHRKRISTNPTRSSSSNLTSRQNDTKLKLAKQGNRRGINDTVYCDHGPTSDYAFIVLRVNMPFAYGTFKKLCKLQESLYTEALRHHLVIDEFCDRHLSGNCCKAWSFATVAAQLLNKTDCMKLNRYDVRTVRNLIYRCSTCKHELYNCSGDFVQFGHCKDSNLPKECNRHEIFVLYQYLIPINGITSRAKGLNETSCALNSRSRKRNSLKELNAMNTLIIFPIAKQVLSEHYDASLLLDSLLKECERMSPTLSLLSVDFGIRESVFKSMLFYDLVYVLCAVLFILIAVCTYTSLLYTLIYVLCMIFSFGISYCVYTTVFGIKFFPFVNLLSVILLIGVGVDDAFIFHRAWMMAENHEPRRDIDEIVCQNMANACATMFITSATTAAAFYSNLLSSIIVVRCFGFFAGTVTLCNYVLCIVWLPAATKLLRKRELVSLNGYVCNIQQSHAVCFQNALRNARRYLSGKLKGFQPNCVTKTNLAAIIARLNWYLLSIFLTLGIVCCLLVFISTEVRLPSSDHFQFFKPHHILERWPMQLKKNYAFTSETMDSPMKIHIVWGIEENSYAKAFDPLDHGFLMPVKFDLWNNNSYLWIRNFCASTAVESFIDYGRLPMLLSCFIDDFLSVLSNQPCLDREAVPCCKNVTNSLRPKRLDFCLKKFLAKYHSQIQEFEALRFDGPSSVGEFFSGPIFDGRTGELKALVVSFFSTFQFSHQFTEMDHFFGTVEKWMQTEMATAPSDINRAWFISENLNRYDLQLALLNSAKIAIPVAISLSIIILLCMTRSCLLTLISVITVTAAIFFLLECLLLLQWEVNVIETTIVTLAIGLSFDYTLHYAAVYRSASLQASNSPLQHVLSKVGGPVLMSMFTTVLGGVCMLFATVYAYFQIGVFMIILAIVSYCFATFLFLPIISILTTIQREPTRCSSSVNRLRLPFILPFTVYREEPPMELNADPVSSTSFIE